MNGYKKMKRLAGMKAIKAVSAVTALSMTVTSLAVAASANSVTPDVISNALGDLKSYGIVAGSFTSVNHFESNFAAKDVILNNDFNVDNYVNRGTRKINFKVTTEETFAPDETKVYTFGVFCNDKPINVIYNGETQNGILSIEFTEAGEKSFTITVPEEYRYETIRIYKLDVVVGENGVQYSTSEAGVDLLPEANNREEMVKNIGSCLIGGSLQVNNVMIGENKKMNLLPEIYDRITQENDGRYSYRQGEYSIIIANRSNEFISVPEAGENVDNLLAQISDASNTLAKVESGSSKVIFGEIDSDIDYGSENERKISELFDKIKENPEMSLLINVKLGDASHFNMKFHSNVDNWDVNTASRIVFNFIGGVQGVTTIYLGDGFRGTVIAPNARVVNESTILGSVYAPEVTNPGGEIHRASYGGFVDYYQAFYFDNPVVTTPEETTTTPDEVTTEETTVPEETTPEETTSEETTTTTTVDEVTEEATTTTSPAPVESTPATTTPAPVVTTTTTTTPPPVVTTTTTTTPPPVVTTTTTPTPPPVVTTTTTPTPPPVVTTTTTPTPPPVVTTTTTPTPPPVVTTTTTTAPVPVEEITLPPVETTTTVLIPVGEITTTTTPAPVPGETTPEEEAPVVTTPETEETAPENTTTVPDVPVVEITTTTTTILIELDEDTPRDELILIDEEVPLGDTPFSTGVDNHLELFITIGSIALLIGVGAQVYTVILKKKN